MRLFFVLAACALSLGAQRHPITHEDVWLMKRVGAPVVSPNGKWAVTLVTEPSYDSAKTVSDLWIVPVDGSAPARRLTSTRSAETGAAFSPDSNRIAFSAEREGDTAPQIYVLPLDGGEAQRVTGLSTGASDPRWRPDGKAILFQSNVYPGARNDEENRKAAEERKARKYNTHAFEGFPFRYWDHWLDDRQPHVFIQPLDEGAKARDLLAGAKLAQSPGFGGASGLAGENLEAVWSPDGAWVLFTATTDRNRGAYAATSTQIFRVPAAGGEPVAVTHGPDSYSRAIFRPDGKVLYASHSVDEAKALYSLTRLVTLAWPNPAEPKFLTPGWDRSVSSIACSWDSRHLYVTVEEAGHDKIFILPADGGTPEKFEEETEGGFSGLAAPQAASGLVVLWGSMTHPEDVFAIDVNKRTRHALTRFNEDRIARIDWQPMREFWFTASNGKRIQSLIVYPPGFDPAKKYPLVLFPHGGPHNMTKDQFFVRWNYHLLASPGYILLLTNYTGSTGYGEDFAAAIHKDILRTPAKEIEEAADAAIKAFPCIDATRQAAIGASYGGYLMAWFEGNTKRFKCLVNHAGLTDNTSFWGATDGAYYWERRNGGPVWEQKGSWVDQSPATYAANFATPMLITHGEHDFRVPINQAFEMYKLLQRRQVPSRLVIFPDASHFVLKGEDARQHMKEVTGWLMRYLGK
ncbi:MAG: S9 family peptidase [Bryobacterales bacterium]|nr:S9 family peptidase [Bryobacterales bacterium]